MVGQLIMCSVVPTPTRYYLFAGLFRRLYVCSDHVSCTLGDIAIQEKENEKCLFFDMFPQVCS